LSCWPKHVLITCTSTPHYQYSYSTLSSSVKFHSCPLASVRLLYPGLTSSYWNRHGGLGLSPTFGLTRSSFGYALLSSFVNFHSYPLCPREVILVQLLARVSAVAPPVCPCPLSDIRSLCAPSGIGPSSNVPLTSCADRLCAHSRRQPRLSSRRWPAFGSCIQT